MALSKNDNKVPEVSAHTATLYVRKLVALEEISAGNQEDALRQLARDYKLGFWQLMHLLKGKAKTCDVSLYARIKLAYLDRCGQMVATLQHEIAIEGAVRGDDFDQDLVAEAAALAAKIAAERAALNQGRQVR